MVTAAMKLKNTLLPGIKAMINLDKVLKSRDITLLTRVHLIKAMVFQVVMYGYKSWTIKKVEGLHRNPWLIHVNVWQKLLQYCKVISLQLIKINGQKKKKKKQKVTNKWQRKKKEESWGPKNWCFWTVVLVKTQESLELLGDPTSPS